MRYHVVVIGGGPIGSVAARCAAEEGARVLLVERSLRPICPPRCAGLVSPATLPMLGASHRSVLRPIRAVRFHTPTGRTLSLRANALKAVVLDRVSLERELHERAADAGVDVRRGVEAALCTTHRVVLETRFGSETVESAVIIGADGPESRVAQAAGLASARGGLWGVQATLEGEAPEPDGVDVYFGQQTAPGFFAWCIPASPGRLRVGLAVAPGVDPALYLDRFLTRSFAGHRVLSRVAGRIPTTPPSRSVIDSVLLVGDAAGQVKPLSGGGLYTGAICARIAGRTAARAALSADGVRSLLASYETEWRRAIGREIAFGNSARALLGTIPDCDLDSMFAAVEDPDLLSFLAERADIDHLHRLVGELARAPSLWARCSRLLRCLSPQDAGQPVASSTIAPPFPGPL